MAKKDKYIPGTPPGSQGPQFENFDTAYEVDQIQKMAMESDKANLVDIDKQLAAADKELRRIKSRVAPAQGNTQTGVAKAAQYESKVIETRRFLESEREAITKILEEKKANLPQSYSSAAEEKNVIKKTIQGPPQIFTATNVEPPKYTAIVDPKGAAIMGTEPAPAKELPNPKATPVEKIYIKDKVMQYPEMNIGITTDTKGNRVPMKGTGPAREYVSERMPMSDKEVIQKYEKRGADYQAKLAQEAITHEKLEFDFEKGEARLVGNDDFIRVEGQEMFARTSGRKNQVVVPAVKANEAIERRAAMTPEERRRADAKTAKEKASNLKAEKIIAKQEADIRQRGNKNLTGTGVKTFEVSSKGSDLGKQFSALNATFKTGPYAGKTIEEVWQKDIKKSGKGRRPGPSSILEEGNIQQSKAEYQKLWEEWGKQNPEKMQELKSVVKRGYTLTDSFAGDPKKTVNQAEALSNITKSVNTTMGTPFKVKPPISKIKDAPKPGGSFEIPAAMKAAAASKVAQAIKKSKGLGMLNVPIMTKGSADKIFKDFLGKKDYSS